MRKPNPLTSRWIIAGGAVLLSVLAIGVTLVYRGNDSDTVAESDSAPQPASAKLQDALPTLKRADKRFSADRLLDPQNDGWTSEAFAEWVKPRLKDIFKQVAAGPLTDPQRAAFASEPIAPLRIAMNSAFRDGAIEVRRSASPSAALADQTITLEEAIRRLIAPLTETGKPKFAIKVIGVSLQQDAPNTTCLYEASVTDGKRTLQQSAEIKCTWSNTTDQAQLVSLTISNLEEVELTGQSPWFVDYTETVLENEPSYPTQLKRGTNHWMERIERAHGMDDSVRVGLAIGDANGDELDDVYVCQGPGLPNKLLIRQPDGTVLDQSVAAGVDFLDPTSSALFVDLDNDGDQDLAVATTGGLVVLENDGVGHFKQQAILTPQMTDVQSLTAVDYDSDGDLDLFQCVYRHESGQAHGEFVFHDATSGGRNYLFRNDSTEAGEWKFTDATDETGLQVGSTRYTLAAAWEDYDNDGDLDLYMANDYGRNFLFQNESGKFADVSNAAGLTDTGFGMSVDWADYNRDGRMDLYIGNMFSSAGSRITNQPNFQTHASPAKRSLYRRLAQGNSLFSNAADGTFRDVSQAAQVQMGRWAWSSVFADLNNDGWEDLVVANGYISTDDTGDL